MAIQFRFARVSNLCRTEVIAENRNRFDHVHSVLFYTIGEKCSLRIGRDNESLFINNVSPTDIEITGLACINIADFIARMAALLV